MFRNLSSLLVLVIVAILASLFFAFSYHYSLFDFNYKDSSNVVKTKTLRKNLQFDRKRPRPIGKIKQDPLRLSDSDTIEPSSLDQKLRDEIEAHDIDTLDRATDYSRSKLRLGRWLFWEKELSGNRQLSCAVCHNPTLATTDKLSLAVGTGAVGDSIFRRPGPETEFVPRNTLSLFNMEQPEKRKLLWDGRIQKKDSETFRTPAGDRLPDSYDRLSAVQAIFPLVTNEEFRGEKGDRDIFGHPNKLAAYKDDAFREIWSKIVDRLMEYKTYRKFFLKSFPVDDIDEINISHVGKAISAFQETAFTLRDSPWDRYLMGHNGALSRRQKKGALLFYGKAKCVSCHSGTIMSDMNFHNIGVPQLGPGKSPHQPYDMGAYRITNDSADKFTFRTPPLRNTSITGPWMHNGAYKSLEGAVRHHFKPIQSMKNYNKEQLARNIQLYHRSPNWISQLTQFPKNSTEAQLIGTVRDKPEDFKKILTTLDPKIQKLPKLTSTEFEQLMWFLFSLTSPTMVMKRFRKQNSKNAQLTQEFRKQTGHLTPYVHSTVSNTTPSGIPIECRSEWC